MHAKVKLRKEIVVDISSSFTVADFANSVLFYFLIDLFDIQNLAKLIKISSAATNQIGLVLIENCISLTL